MCNWFHFHFSLVLTHRGRVTHICFSKLTIIGSDYGLLPRRRQSIIWTNAGILLIGPLGTKFSAILIEILAVLFTKMDLKMSSAKWRPFCLGLSVLTTESKEYDIKAKDCTITSNRDSAKLLLIYYLYMCCKSSYYTSYICVAITCWIEQNINMENFTQNDIWNGFTHSPSICLHHISTCISKFGVALPLWH